MRDNVVESYEHYREEDRLTTNNARRMEFLTTTRVLQGWVGPSSNVLDCAAGTGVYAMHLAEQGHHVTALDLTPRHVEYMNEQLKGKSYTMETGVNDATDLSQFEDNTFDVVLNMGPVYHLTALADRHRTIAECTRVLRPGGLLAVAYIGRYFAFAVSALNKPDKVMNIRAMEKFLAGSMPAYDPDNHWTDAYYATPEDVISLVSQYPLDIVDHFAADGLSPGIHQAVDALTDAQFEAWCEFHYRTCREPSLLGASNHGMIIARKQ